MRDNLGLNFEGLAFSRFVGRSDLQFDIASLIAEVKNRSQRHDLQEEALERSLRLAYEKADFAQAPPCESIRRWQSANPPYTVLEP
jgi:hypothetical protein